MELAFVVALHFGSGHDFQPRKAVKECKDISAGIVVYDRVAQFKTYHNTYYMNTAN